MSVPEREPAGVPREAGWYWVKWHESGNGAGLPLPGPWRIAEFDAGNSEWIDDKRSRRRTFPMQVGPRIVSPDDRSANPGEVAGSASSGALETPSSSRGHREDCTAASASPELTELFVDRPSPDERTPDTAPAPEREAFAWLYQWVGQVNAPAWLLDNLSALASGNPAPHEWKYPAMANAAAKQPEPPVSAERLRFLANEAMRNWLDGTKMPQGTGDELRKLADWLPAPPDLERRHE